MAASAQDTRSLKIKKNRLHFKSGRDIPHYLLILPAFALILVFNYVPIYGIVMAFQNFSPYLGISGSSFVGFKHFAYFLQDGNFWRVMGNTIIINLYQLIFGMPVPIIFALLLNEVRISFFKRSIQTISYLPHFISWVVAASIFNAVLSPSSGIVNSILMRFFGLSEPIYFLVKANYFRTILVGSNIWKTFGMSAVYYLAALSAIDPQLYEAAKIDGANRWQQTRHVTLMGIAPIFILLLILNVGSMITIGFEQIFLLYNPMVYNVGDVISTYVYRLGILNTQYSLTTAIGVTQSVVNFALVFAANKIARKVVGYSMW
ncbi:MAG: ABC transporter permease subunit [Clostridiaceae bacterium]|nr:ABC transporter permease subunit [Clostridiaceae bacterium]